MPYFENQIIDYGLQVSPIVPKAFSLCASCQYRSFSLSGQELWCNSGELDKN